MNNYLVYLIDAEKFKNLNDSLLICDELIKLCEHLREMSELGTKFLPNQRPNIPCESLNFNLFINEISTFNNTILGVFENGKILINAFKHPDYLICKDKRLCDDTEDWFKTMIKNCTPISGYARKQRNWYFNRLIEKIELARENIIARLNFINQYKPNY